MNPIANPELTAAINRLWEQFLPQMRERVATLEVAAAAFGANKLSAAQKAQASDAAHKLAGALGSFGLTRGTVLARELEILYSRESGPDATLAAQLKGNAVELGKLIENRK